MRRANESYIIFAAHPLVKRLLRAGQTLGLSQGHIPNLPRWIWEKRPQIQYQGTIKAYFNSFQREARHECFHWEE